MAVGHVRDSFLQLWFCWNVQRTRLSLQVPHPLSSEGFELIYSFVVFAVCCKNQLNMMITFKTW